MAQIQRTVVESNKPNSISRLFYAKKDEIAIAAWRSDLNRILHVFEVHSIVRSLSTLLTAHLQTEFALHVHAVVSDVRPGVANTHGPVYSIHRAVVETQDGTDVTNQVVGSYCALFTIKYPS